MVSEAIIEDEILVNGERLQLSKVYCVVGVKGKCIRAKKSKKQKYFKKNGAINNVKCNKRSSTKRTKNGHYGLK